MDTQEYRENVRKLNKNEMILKARQAIALMNSVLDILEDPEVNSSIGISNPEYTGDMGGPGIQK